ncbi:D-arabinono-1,4-lactone oxidase [Bacillus pseudomycoides]|uniref:D-arabinono-1,4-lactone oxidase n=1 Tax=Bacillus pseudomycoides TaxID=64104 RepID=UPI000BF09510|nr:D-arabinono-1,4-lactone oxidase [Bacillus pseudomycoides]PEI48009.1 FAD-binding oxidoreductase [Bacillus pseudomycoides]PGA72368.1 FAD-binding oxidoreductase [Bacillus pseudomycoides]PGE97539.1 FAD-binding oxidoreductase [Bacillus pseudomycoides]PHE21013.1 FAD-binding oxidoreductase [Bacillus pseudomycoides]PHE40383.1 FAD-binding oxidoreductase [Bacillus pseudomycoides]
MLSVKGQKWRNWAGNVEGNPQYTMYPKNIQDVIEVVKFAKEQGKRIRVVGSGHSFTPLVQTEEILISLDEIQGIVDVDSQSFIVEVWGGTKLYNLGKLLEDKGYAQENLGDIDSQSIAGAISTGTHGTGIQFGSLATQVVEVTAVLASGEIIVCSEKENPEFWKAFQLSLGMLGIIVKVKLKVIPAYSLIYESRKESFSTVINKLEKYKQHRHFEFFVFPYSDDVQVKITNETAEKGIDLKWHKIKTELLENIAFSLLSKGCKWIPSISKGVSRLSAKAVPSTKTIGPSYQIFATSRNVRFYEMEYSVPAQYMKDVVGEIYNLIEKKKFQVHFPIECRYVKGDDIWISPAYRRDSAYIAVHMYKGMKYAAYFTAIEHIFQKYEGRPHWGKMHTMRYEPLQCVYPKLNSFLEVRGKLDPMGMFLNPYVAKMFSIYEKS